MSALDRELVLVELVDEQGCPAGTASVAEAHKPPGMPHRAFSVVLHDEAGRFLIQRRAATKARFPLLWSNACCGHPLPGEDVARAAARRLEEEELGISSPPLTEAGVHSYRANDWQSGLVEQEYDHVLVGEYTGTPPRPNPDEVESWEWILPRELATDLWLRHNFYTPWLPGVLSVVETS